MSITEGLTSSGEVSLVIQPIRNLLKIQTIVSETQNGLVEEVLIFVVGCNPKMGNTH